LQAAVCGHEGGKDRRGKEKKVLEKTKKEEGSKRVEEKIYIYYILISRLFHNPCILYM